MDSYLIFTNILIVLLAVMLLGLLLGLVYLLLPGSRDESLGQSEIFLPPSSKEELARWRVQEDEVLSLHIIGTRVEQEKHRQQKAFARHNRLNDRSLRALRWLKNAICSLVPHKIRHKKLLKRAMDCRDKIHFLTRQYWQNPQEQEDLLPVISWRCHQMTEAIGEIEALVSQGSRQSARVDKPMTDQPMKNQKKAAPSPHTKTSIDPASQEKGKDQQELLRQAEVEINPVRQLEDEERKLYEELLAEARFHRNELRFLTRQYMQRPQEQAALRPIIALHRQQLAAAIKQSEILRLLEES